MAKSIILVGANGSGKSTLGAKLREVLDLPYHHAGPSPGGVVEAFEACLLQVKLLDSGVVLDRATPICRRVYERPIYDSEEIFLKLFTSHMSKQATIIHCVGSGEFTKKDYYPEGHFEEIVQKQDMIRARYLEVLQDVPHLTYNWQTDSVDDLIRKLK